MFSFFLQKKKNPRHNSRSLSILCLILIIFFPPFFLILVCLIHSEDIATPFDNPHLILLFYLTQLFLRELVRSYHLLKIIPMDMSGYFGKILFFIYFLYEKRESLTSETETKRQRPNFSHFASLSFLLSLTHVDVAMSCINYV